MGDQLIFSCFSLQVVRLEVQRDKRIFPHCSDTQPSQRRISPGKKSQGSNSGSEEQQTKADANATSGRHHRCRGTVGSNDIVVTARQDHLGNSSCSSQPRRTSTARSARIRRQESALVSPVHTDGDMLSSCPTLQSTGVKSGTAMQPPVTPSPQQPESVSLTDAQSMVLIHGTHGRGKGPHATELKTRRVSRTPVTRLTRSAIRSAIRSVVSPRKIADAEDEVCNSLLPYAQTHVAFHQP